jgi:hypothetical protein
LHLSAIPLTAIGFSEEKPDPAKAIINAKNTTKAVIVVCWLVGVWRAEPCLYWFGNQICPVTNDLGGNWDIIRQY